MLIYAILILLLVGADQLTKYLAASYLAPVGTAPFLPGIMELRYVENDGMAFSMLSGRQTLLIVVTGITLAALDGIFFSKGRRCAPSVWPCALLSQAGLATLSTA